MEQKMIASEIFKDKKDNYPQSVPKLFVSTRLGKPLLTLQPTGYKCFQISECVCSYSDGENINPKVVQALGSEKMKVSEALDSFNYKLSISMYWSSCAFVPSMQCRSPSTTGGATSPAPGSCCSLPTVPLLQRRASSSSALTTVLWKVRGQKQTDASRVFLSFSGCLSHDLE